MFEYSNGFRKTMYWSKAKMISHADRYSQAFSANATGGRYPKVSFADYEAGKVPKGDEWLYSSFWYKDFDAMALKTMIRQLISKWGIMSIDLREAMEKDDSIIREDMSADYVEEADPAMSAPPDPVDEPEIEAEAIVVNQAPKPQPAPAQTRQDAQRSFQSLEDEFFG